jgi:hypothetical protein
VDLVTALAQLAREDLTQAQAVEAGRAVARELSGLALLARGRVWEPGRLRTQGEFLEFALALAAEGRARRPQRPPSGPAPAPPSATAPAGATRGAPWVSRRRPQGRPGAG